MIRSKRKFIRNSAKNAGKHIRNLLALMVLCNTFLPQAQAEEISPPVGQAENLTGFTLEMITVEAAIPEWWGKKASQSVSVITKEDIEKKQAKSVEDIIFSETGVTRTVDSLGRVGISIRGADPRHTLMLIDGQPVISDVSKYLGAADEAMRIGAENIERIEIIRGASSARYGADAIGGVVNIITKEPAAEPGFRLNAEARYHKHDGTDENKNTWPSNYYLRADSGKIDNVKFSIFGSKRDILPVYSDERAYKAGQLNGWYEDFRPSLRYYGNAKNIGANLELEINQDNKITFRGMKEKEDVQRRNKNSTDYIETFFEPMQIFRRRMDRDTCGVTYTGRSGKGDWQFDVAYGKMKEKDTGITTYFNKGRDDYSGKNGLAALDWVEHKQLDANAVFNYAPDEKHFFTYGLGYTDEKADGTRLKNAPKRWIKSIDPWDYERSLYVPIGQGGKSGAPDSQIHNYDFIHNEDGTLQWNRNLEYYNGQTAPPFTYEEYKEWTTTRLPFNGADEAAKILAEYESWGYLPAGTYQNALQGALDGGSITREQYDRLLTAGTRHDAFANILSGLNPGYDTHYRDIVDIYYGGGDTLTAFTPEERRALKYNNAYFKENFDSRKNKLSGGEASLKKRRFFVQDIWKIDDNTILTPILRLDNSDKFGSQFTASLGMTHNLGGNPHRRLKANIGTGYAEPGLGELYYNWEMYGSSGGTHYGWYWVGNPNLRPEKSLNFDIGIEGENDKTFARASVFRNVIDDYMTVYFAGQLIDFGSYLNANNTLSLDRLYTFKNIGKAEITGVEAEVQQRFNDNWSAKLGYAWLHAINKSDPDMPRQLLDRPQHKVDVSLNYEDKKHGWKAALWGDYYLRMLDSNSIANTYSSDDFNAGTGVWKKKAPRYQRKTFGIWNVMLQKDFGKDVTAYVGVDNLFNYRDDDRAYQDRLYRIGLNMKFGAPAAEETAAKTAGTDAKASPETVNDGVLTAGDWFLARPSDKDDGRKKGDLKVIGDYRLRSKMWGGEDLAGMKKSAVVSLDDEAVRNMKDEPGHSLEQRLRLGVDLQLGENTNLVVEGASGDLIDTQYTEAKNRGIRDIRLERAELNQKAEKWDFTIGRLSERMGTTGYWFGKEYTGARAVWTDKNTQIRMGGGDFSFSTGIRNSAYSHAEQGVFMRAPTLFEVLGVETRDNTSKLHPYTGYSKTPDYRTEQLDYWDKFIHATDGLTDPVAKADARLAVISELGNLLRGVGEAGGTIYTGKDYYNNKFLRANRHWLDVDDDSGVVTNPMIQMFTVASQYEGDGIDAFIRKSDGTMLDLSKKEVAAAEFKRTGDYPEYKKQYYRQSDIGYLRGGLKHPIIALSFDDIFSTNGKKAIYGYLQSITNAVKAEYAKKGETISFVNSDGTLLTEQQQLDKMYVNFVGIDMDPTTYMGSKNIINGFISNLISYGQYAPTNGANNLPLSGLPENIPAMGTFIKHDVIPEIDTAAFVQVRQKLSDCFGLNAWYLRSFGNGFHVQDKELNVADVFGAGAQYKMGKSAISFDWGRNRSETGRYYNGARGTWGDYRGGGSSPSFWVLRFDVGQADMNVPGSWNAFADYKSFQHGSFLGGNGTGFLSDRYLDGIRSFTIGAGYVPAKNLLLEAFYTFGAKSTGQRDVVHGGDTLSKENFSLGDYTMLQATYRF